MKISDKSWAKYIEKLRKVNDTAANKMLAFLNLHRDEDGLWNSPETRQLVLEYAYGLSVKYGEAAAELACEMYDMTAEASNVSIPAAEPAETATYGEVAKAVNGTMKTANEKIIAQSVGRLVKMVGVDTVMQNALRDGAEWAWIPRGDTCAFCITLASRGWQKASRKALKNGHAEHIHANCDCTYGVRFDKDTEVEGYDPDEYLEMYETADGATPTDRINAMRRQNYARNEDKINAQKRAAYTKQKELTDNKGVAKIKVKNNAYEDRKEVLEKYVGKPITETDNQSVREWYVANVESIPKMIDRSKNFHEQVRQAFELRNRFKHEARVAMSDEETAAKLERTRPAPTFESLVESKMKRKNLTRQEALEDILKTASKTNDDVNKEFGL